jgi:hypothetical protein
MNNMLRQFVLGVGSIILAPANALPQHSLRITIPPETATSAIAHDFSTVSKDLTHSVSRVDKTVQLELGV